MRSHVINADAGFAYIVPVASLDIKCWG